MVSLNWFVANYTHISKADIDKYVRIFCIEENDRIYDTIVFETQQLVVKKLIWKSDLPPVEKHKKELEVLCKSGYFNRKYRTPFDIASINQVCQTLEKIRKNNKKTKR